MIHKVTISDEEFCTPIGYISLMDVCAKKIGTAITILCRYPKCRKNGKRAVDVAVVKQENSSDTESYLVPLCCDCFENECCFEVHGPLVCISDLNKKFIP